MRHALLLGALLLLPALVGPGAAGVEDPPAAWAPGRNDYRLEMRDGTELDATMVVPQGTQPGARLPALVVIHGYGGSKEVRFATEAAARGYVGFAYSVRGFGQSTGKMDVVGPGSLGDLKEVLAWLKAHGPVDPARVGVTGASYGGGHSLRIAAEPDAGVAAVAPLVGWTDLAHAIAPSGAFKFTYITGFHLSGHGVVDDGCHPMCLAVDVPAPAAGLVDEHLGLDVDRVDLGRRALYDTYDPRWHQTYLALLTDVGRGAAMQYLAERSVRWQVEDIRVPIFLVQGLNDDLFPADQVLPFFDLLPSAEKGLYLGYVGHPRAVAKGPEVDAAFARVWAFFDHYLQGKGPRPFDPAAPIEVAGQPWDGRTLRLARWPGSAGALAFALTVEGGLAAEPGRAGVATIANTLAAGVPDDAALGSFLPQAQEVPGSTPLDTLVFRTAPLAGAAELLGTPRAELALRSTGLGHQVAVKLYDRDPATGHAELVTRGIHRIQDNVPLTPQRLLVDLQPYRHTFPAGHEVELRIAASDAPSFLPEKGPFTTTLLLGEGGSRLLLPLGPPR